MRLISDRYFTRYNLRLSIYSHVNAHTVYVCIGMWAGASSYPVETWQIVILYIAAPPPLHPFYLQDWTRYIEQQCTYC